MTIYTKKKEKTLSESLTMYPSSIIIENTNNGYIVSYKDISHLAETYDININEALDLILKENNLPSNNLIVSAYEYEVIEDPESFNEINFCLKEEGLFSDSNIFVGSIINEYFETNNDELFDALINEDCVEDKYMFNMIDKYYSLISEEANNKNNDYSSEKVKNRIDKIFDNHDENIKNIMHNFISKNNKMIEDMFNNIGKRHDRNTTSSKPKYSPSEDIPKSTKKVNADYPRKEEINPTDITNRNNTRKAPRGIGLVGLGLAGYGSYRLYNRIVSQSKNKPRTWIAKKIAALRSVYHKFMVQAQRNPQKSGAIKRIAAKILAVIDKLMARLQTATN